MLSSFRNLSKSKVGTVILVMLLVAIAASFALADMGNVRSGGFGLSSGSLAKAGGQPLTERDLSEAFGRALSQLRTQRPDATGADLAGEFDPFVDELISERAIVDFADQNGVVFSPRLVDSQIALIPGTTGLDGKFSEQAYATWLGRQRLTDGLVRRMLTADLARRAVLLPASAEARMPVKMATQYASMLLEQRQGQIAMVMIEPFKAGLTPSAGELQSFYSHSKTRYMAPEQRVLRFAAIRPGEIKAAAPSEQEIAAYYKANAATYAGSESRVLSQVITADKRVADQVSASAKRGLSFLEAAKPSGQSAEDVSVGPQTRNEYAALAGADVATATFAAAKGAVIGPIRSDLGWVVVKVDDIKGASGRSLDQARGDIATLLTTAKDKNALEDKVGEVEDRIQDGASLPEAAAAAGLKLQQTPLVTALGKSLTQPGFAFPADLAAVLKTGFDLAADEPPTVVELGEGKGYAIIAVGQLVGAAPEPLDRIRDRVSVDWVQKKASDLARATASGIAAKVAKGVPIAEATGSGKGIVAPRPITARRLQLSQVQGPGAAPLQMLFSLGAGKSRMIAGPEGKAYFIVRTDRIIPGNATLQPDLITEVQKSFRQTTGQELAQQFLGAVKKDVGVTRDEKAIAAAKARLTDAGQ